MHKRGALELSIGTIVIIVLAMTMLILGMVLIRKIMCSGIIITEEVTTGLENEIKGLFQVNNYGVRCMGEEGQEVRLGDGGRRQIACVIKTDESKDYELKVKSIESLQGVSTSSVQKWVIDENWKGSVSAGEKTVAVAVLDIPKNVDSTSLKIVVQEISDSGEETHTLYVDVVHLGRFTTAVC